MYKISESSDSGSDPTFTPLKCVITYNLLLGEVNLLKQRCHVIPECSKPKHAQKWKLSLAYSDFKQT